MRNAQTFLEFVHIPQNAFIGHENAANAVLAILFHILQGINNLIDVEIESPVNTEESVIPSPYRALGEPE